MAGILYALANAMTAPANRLLKEMTSQLPEVCPFIKTSDCDVKTVKNEQSVH